MSKYKWTSTKVLLMHINGILVWISSCRICLMGTIPHLLRLYNISKNDIVVENSSIKAFHLYYSKIGLEGFFLPYLGFHCYCHPFSFWLVWIPADSCTCHIQHISS